jgi:hypothetical protein
LYKYVAAVGESAIDPIASGIIDKPTAEGTDDTKYTYNRWSNLPDNIQGPHNIIAIYDANFRV